MPKRSSKTPPRDINQLAKYIGDQVTKPVSDEDRPLMKAEPILDKNAAAVLLGRLGGLKGGRARAEKMSPEKRTKIARKAAKARWAKYKKDK